MQVHRLYELIDSASRDRALLYGAKPRAALYSRWNPSAIPEARTTRNHSIHALFSPGRRTTTGDPGSRMTFNL